MSLLEDLISRDSTRIWSASCAVRHLRDEAALVELATHITHIRESTHGVDLGGALRPNSSHLAFALRKLEWVRDRQGCLCGLYTHDDLYSPVEEAAKGNIRIQQTHLLEGGYVDFYEVTCALCNTPFKVTEQEYHYPWWRWEPLNRPWQ
jgi:hypothetical protein